MPRKSKPLFWLQSFNALGRARTAVKAATAKPKPPKTTGTWTSGMAWGPAGMRRYQLLVPPGVKLFERLPLLVMLHGCRQDANGFALGTRMNQLAVKERFLVLYPEQSRSANLQGCWNWYDTNNRLAYSEVATLIAAIDQACLLYPVDANRVAVAGLSAGASMAALMASQMPTRFKAVVMHSGIPPGTAHSSLSALRAMAGRAPTAAATAAVRWPPLMVIHGSEDHTVSPSNGEAAAELWAAATGARRAPSQEVQRGERHKMTVTPFKARGQPVATLCLVHGLGHAWSGGAAGQAYCDAKGPDASRMIWTFASKHFGDV